MESAATLLAPIVTAAAATVREVVGMLFDPAERIFWGFLVSTAVVAWMVTRVDGGGATSRTPGRAWSRSSLVDLELLVVNTALRVGAGAFATVSAFGLAVWLVGRADAWLGVPTRPPIPAPVIAAIYTVVMFVAWDGSRYLLHRWMHEVPWLWELHKVHHSAENLTPLTLYRTHPIESALFGIRGVLVTAPLTALFFWLFRRDAIELELLGVNVFGFVFSVIGANLRHSHVWWTWGRLERWLMSPAQHQMHHGVDDDGTTNLGTWIAVWDRWAGTLRHAGDEPPRAFGLPAAQANHDPQRLGSALVRPLVFAWARLNPRARRWGVPIGLAIAASCPVADAGAAPTLDPDAPVPFEDTPAPRDEDIATPDEPSDEVPGEPAPTTPTEPSATTPSEPPAPTPTESPATVVAPPPAQPPLPPPPSDAILENDDETINRTVIVGSMFDGDALPRVAGSAHVVGKRELEAREYDDVHKIMATIPGVYVRGEDGYGLRPNIGMRGANPDRSAKVTLMEDGVLLAPAPYSAPAAYYFPMPTRMVGVEVFKGPAAIRFGPNTIGGAINMRTRDVPQSNASTVDVAGGRFGYIKGHGFYGGSWRGFGILIEAAHLESTGFKKLDNGGDTGFNKNDAMIKLSYETRVGTTFHRVTLKGGYATERSNETYTGLTRADFEATPYRRYAGSALDRMTWWRSQAQLSYVVATPTLELQTSLYRHDFHRIWRRLDSFRDGPDINSVLANPDAGQYAVFAGVLSGAQDAASPDQALMVIHNNRRFVSQGIQSVLHWRPTHGIVSQDLEVGVRLHHDGITRNQVESGYLMTSGTMVPDNLPSVAITRNNGEAIAFAVHVHDAITLWDRLTFAPGIRVETISMRYLDRLLDARSRRLDVAVTPGIGALVDALPWLAVFAGANRGFSPVAPGQPKSVKPEYAMNYEAGVRAIRRRLWAEAVGFFSNYSNLNGMCTDAGGCGDGSDGSQMFNGNRVFVYGLESMLKFKHRFRNRLRLEAGARYTFTGSQFRSSFISGFPQWGDVQVGDELPYLPKHVVGGSLGLGGDFWDVSVAPNYNGAMRDVAGQGAIAKDEKIPGFFVMDVSGELSILKRLRLYTQIGNVTNSTYIASYRPFGIRPGAPLTFMIGVKVDAFGTDAPRPGSLVDAIRRRSRRSARR